MYMYLLTTFAERAGEAAAKLGTAEAGRCCLINADLNSCICVSKYLQWLVSMYTSVFETGHWAVTRFSYRLKTLKLAFISACLRNLCFLFWFSQKLASLPREKSVHEKCVCLIDKLLQAFSYQYSSAPTNMTKATLACLWIDCYTSL